MMMSNSQINTHSTVEVTATRDTPLILLQGSLFSSAFAFNFLIVLIRARVANLSIECWNRAVPGN